LYLRLLSQVTDIELNGHGAVNGIGPVVDLECGEKDDVKGDLSDPRPLEAGPGSSADEIGLKVRPFKEQRTQTSFSATILSRGPSLRHDIRYIQPGEPNQNTYIFMGHMVHAAHLRAINRRSSAVPVPLAEFGSAHRCFARMRGVFGPGISRCGPRRTPE